MSANSYTAPTLCPVCESPTSICSCDTDPASRLALHLISKAEGGQHTATVYITDLLTICGRAYEWGQIKTKEVLAGPKESAIEIVRKHRRHVELSPGVGADAQSYALAVCDDILGDLGSSATAESG